MSVLLKIARAKALCLVIVPTILIFGQKDNNYAARAQTQNILPSKYSGVWRGNGMQKNPSSEWSILMALTGGEVDSIVGTIAYPSLNCGGELSLRRISSGFVELSESITYGNCINNGVITLKTSSTRGLDYRWQKSPTNASGKLQKISN